MNLDDFRSKQSSIYADMRKEEREQSMVSGIMVDPPLLARRGGFYLSLIHPPALAEKASILSAKVGSLVKAMVYSSDDVHTTAGWLATSVMSHFYFNPEKNLSHSLNLKDVTLLAEKVARDTKADSCEINFWDRPVLLPRGVWTVGQPNQETLNLLDRVFRAGERLGVDVGMPTNLHMSLNRFTETKPADELGELFCLIESEPALGVSYPIGIAAGYTLRHESERSVTDLRETPGHFHSVQFFPFRQ